MSEPTCSRCGYDLAGLRRGRGNCPECGEYFDLTSGQGVTGRAADRHRRGERFAARLRTILLGLLAVGLMGVGGVLSLVAKNPWGPVLTLGLFAGLAAMATVVSLLGERDEG